MQARLPVSLRKKEKKIILTYPRKHALSPGKMDRGLVKARIGILTQVLVWRSHMVRGL